MEKKNSVAQKAKNAAQTRSKTMDAQSALAIFKDFYKAFRKEFLKLENVNTTVTIGGGMNGLHFVAEGFDMNLIVKEGGVA